MSGSKTKISFALKQDKFSSRIRNRVFSEFTQAEHRYADAFVFSKAAFWLLSTLLFYFLCLTTELGFLGHILYAVASAYSLFFLVINTCHDAVHGCLWVSKRANRITHALLFNLLGVDSRLWGLRHLRSHHLFPNIPGCDSDIDETAIIRLSPHNRWRPIYRIQHFYLLLIYAILPLHSVFYQDIAYLFRKDIANVHNIQHSKIEVLQFIFLKIVYFFFWIVLPWVIIGSSFLSVFLGYLLVNFLLGPAFIPIAATHLNDKAAHPKLDDSKIIQTSYTRFQLASSLDWAPLSEVATFFYGGLNSHAAHHLFPRISHRHYHWITKIIREECKEFNIPYHSTSFIGSFVSHFKYIKHLGISKIVRLDLKEEL
ncbi:MAG: fatty acid desaturase [Oligoflexia bacterium]|nr:fatty acid desaturase [Oligoflexia bacterium]